MAPPRPRRRNSPPRRGWRAGDAAASRLARTNAVDSDEGHGEDDVGSVHGDDANENESPMESEAAAVGGARAAAVAAASASAEGIRSGVRRRLRAEWARRRRSRRARRASPARRTWRRNAARDYSWDFDRACGGSPRDSRRSRRRYFVSSGLTVQSTRRDWERRL